MNDEDNIVLCWPDYSHDATLVSLAGTYQAGWPLTNLNIWELSEKARTVNTVPVNIGITLFRLRLVGAVCISNHNLTTSAQFRVKVYKDASKQTLRHDSGLLYVWPRIYQAGDLPWESDNWWSGVIEEEQRQEFTSLCYHFLPDNVEAQYLELEIFDEGNPDGYLEYGGIFVGRLFQPVLNPRFDEIDFGTIDSSEVDEAGDGTDYFYQRRKRRTVNFALRYLSLNEAFGAVYDSHRTVGITGNMLFAMSRTPGAYSYATTFLCRYTQLDKISFPYVDGYASSFQLKERV